MHKLRMQLLATAATVSLSGAAWAADMPVKAPPPVAPVPTVANWTGFYVGGQIGGASFDPSCQSPGPTGDNGYISVCQNTSAEAESDPVSSGSLSSDSVIGGGRVGADYQWDRVVLGIVGQIDWTHLRSSLNNPQPDSYFSNATATVGEQIDWLASLRGRVGWAFDNVLFYATGGVAWTEIKTNASFNTNCPYGDGPEENFTSQNSVHKTGAVVGGGFEYRVTQHVSVVGELLGYHFGSVSLTGVDGYGSTYTTQFKNQDILAGTLGVNWRF